jgi:uncharacterized protein
MSEGCPICRKNVRPRSENASFPFCSARCKTIDLGKWLSGDYRIATNEQADGFETDDTTTLAAGNRKEMPS